MYVVFFGAGTCAVVPLTLAQRLSLVIHAVVNIIGSTSRSFVSFLTNIVLVTLSHRAIFVADVDAPLLREMVTHGKPKAKKLTEKRRKYLERQPRDEDHLLLLLQRLTVI